MDIFDNTEPTLKRYPSHLDEHKLDSTLARVTKIKNKYLVDLITRTNETLKDVRVFGPAILEGKAHGRSIGLKKNQMVLVNFIGGSIRYPVVANVFPFFAADSDIKNLNIFWDKFKSIINFETDIIDFHESGYFVRQTQNKIQFYDSNLGKIGEIDFNQKKVSWEADLDIKGNLSVEGDISFKGDMEVDGEISATKLIQSDEDVRAGEIALKEHRHPTTAPGDPTGSSIPG